MPPAAILDVDGTLVDTNYQHVIAWSRAFARHDIVLPLWRIHRHIGMGGDQLVAALPFDVFPGECADDLVSAHADVPVDAPEGENDAVAAESPIPRDDVVVIGVDEGPVDVEDRCWGHGAKLPG